MNSGKSLGLYALVLACITLISVKANAGAPVEFASFSESGTYTYTNNGNGSYFSSTPIAINDFDFDVPTAVQPTAYQNISDVYLTILGTVSGPATVQPGFGNSIDVQPFSSLTFTFAQGSGAATPQSTLLTATVSGANLNIQGSDGGFGLYSTPATFPTDTDGETFSFSSQYLNFPAQAPASATLDFDGIAPGVGIDPTPGAGDGYLSTFTGTINGNFAVYPGPTTAPAPEASTMVSFSVVLAGLLGIVFFRRKRSTDIS